MSDQRPEYTVYRSRRGLLDRLRPSDERGVGLPRRRRGGGSGGLRRSLTPRRLLKYAALALLGWILLSVAVFFVSAQLKPGVSPRAERALDGPLDSLLTGSTVLVIGSDARPPGSKEGGGAARADSILLLHAGFGSVSRLSILRDSQAAIPGHGTQKINAAYALGGTALTIRTVEAFLGNDLEIDHVLEVSFEDFPRVINAMGGIDVTLRRCVRSPPFSGRRFSLGRGEHRLTGRQALDFARVRKNRCAPNESDEARAARQQQVLAAIRSRALSPFVLPRLPWVAWQAPRTFTTDLQGPGLAMLFVDLLTSGSPKGQILRGTPLSDGTIQVSETEKAAAVEELVGE